jgi:hypothetical protein
MLTAVEFNGRYTVTFVGQEVMTGAVVSTTVTVIVFVDVLLASSVADR